MANPLSEEFNRVGDYILRVDFRLQEGRYSDVVKYNGYTRIFNFLSRQVTTIHRDWMCEGRGSQAGGTSAMASHVETQGFDDLPSAEEITVMHRKLCELGGTPPALEDVIPENIAKAAPRLRRS